MMHTQLAPHFAIAERRVGDLLVLDLTGNLTFGEATTQLRQELRRVLAEGERKLLLNFAGVRFLDSAGMGELVAGYAAAGRAGGQFKLAGLNPNVLDLLVMTRLVTIFDIYDTEQQAEAAFA